MGKLMSSSPISDPEVPIAWFAVESNWLDGTKACFDATSIVKRITFQLILWYVVFDSKPYLCICLLADGHVMLSAV